MPSPVRIAFLADTVATDRAGTERQMLECLSRIDRRRFDPELVVMRSSPWLREANLDCPVWDLGYDGFVSVRFPAVLRRFRELVRRRRYELVHTFLEESIVVAGLATCGLPRPPALVSSRRDTGLGGEHPWYQDLLLAVRPTINRRYRTIVANGSRVRDFTIERERVDPDRVRVVPNGVHLPERDLPAPEPIAGDPTGPWIVAVANLKPVKGLVVLLEAFGRVLKRMPDSSARLLILGEGPLRRELEDRSSRGQLLGRVYLPGAVSDVRPYLAHATLAVSSSEREGLSNALLEAMAAGLPLVVTDVGENKDLVDSSNGIVVPPSDPSALASGMVRLLDDPPLRRRMAEASLARVSSRFGWPAALRTLESVYAEALGSRDGGGS